MNASQIPLFASCAMFVTLLGACSSAEDANRVVGELASDRIEITAEFAEPVVEIVTAEGAVVRKGQVLLRQDTSRVEARLAELDAAVLQQRARLDELIRGPRSEQIAAARASLEGATQELDFRKAEMARIDDIYQKGLASAELLDSARAALDAARAGFKLAQAQLEERLAGTTLEELKQAEQVLQQATARRDSAAIDFDRHTLTAPADGILDSRLFEIGERPLPGQPVLIVLGGEQVHARVYVPEALRAQVRAGTRALIHVDGISDVIEGRVRWVANEPAFTPYFALTERDRGRLSYVAKVDLSEDRERLPDGVPVEVEFLIDSGR